MAAKGLQKRVTFEGDLEERKAGGESKASRGREGLRTLRPGKEDLGRASGEKKGFCVGEIRGKKSLPRLREEE